MDTSAGKKEKQKQNQMNGDDPKKTDKKPSKLHAFVKKQLTLPDWVRNNYKQWKVSLRAILHKTSSCPASCAASSI
jgi:hypothetical protein